MQFENTQVFGVENALYGMRLPLNLSLAEVKGKSDSESDHIGAIDLSLAQKLINADKSYNSQPNSKFLRMIHVQVCITAPAYWFAEADTYKVGTVRNSSSLQHKGMAKDYTLDDFAIDNVENIKADIATNKLELIASHYWKHLLEYLNGLRKLYLETKDYSYFRALRQAMPMSYLYTSMFDTNYAVLRTIIGQRKHHKLSEWHEFIDWCNSLPYAKELLLGVFNEK